ncbi:MAG: DUF3098 domain-containing protein [Prevotella sp.]|nr:DUF3098 domain-containing protein [Prevotella sp.]
MNKRNYAFGRTNFILIAAGMIVVVLGFILMSGSSSSEDAFNPDIFSTMRIKVAPIVCLLGFVSLIYGIVRKPKDTEEATTAAVSPAKEMTAEKEMTATKPMNNNKETTKPYQIQKKQKRRR